MTSTASGVLAGSPKQILDKWGSLENWDVPMRVAGDRANVSQDVLDAYYDRRSN